MIYDLELDLKTSKIIQERLASVSFARDLYSALCNVGWLPIYKESDEDAVAAILKHGDNLIYTSSWRYAGGVVADLRNKYYPVEEIYLDYYAGGNEGIVTTEISEVMKTLGWKPKY
jgi:hypothetical protein